MKKIKEIIIFYRDEFINFIFPFIEIESFLKPIYIEKYTFSHKNGITSIKKIYLFGIRIFESKIIDES